MKKRTLSIISLVMLVVFAGVAKEPIIVEKEFSGITSIVVGTVSGNCNIVKSNTETLIVKVEYDYKPSDSFEPVFTQENDKLVLKEDMKGKNSGNSDWTLTVPNNIEITYGTVSGNLIAENLSLKLNIGTVSGNVELNNMTLTDKFEAGTVSGNVKAENVIFNDNAKIGTVSGNVKAEKAIFKGECNLGSVSGNVELTLMNAPTHDIGLGSVSGNSKIDLNGNKLTGSLEMKVKKNKGEIECPFKFEEEKEIEENNNKFLVKSKTFKSESPKITIHTVSGKAILVK